MHKYSTGTDGHRTIGRTWHVSRLKKSALAEAICWSTRNEQPLPHHEMIRTPLPLTIRCWCLGLAIHKPHLILAGRSRPRHGTPCSSVSSRRNRSVTSRGITACRMRRSGVCCASPLCGMCEHGSPTWPVEHPASARADKGRSRSVVCSRFLWHTSSVLQRGGVHTGSTWTVDGSQTGRRSKKGVDEAHTLTLRTAWGRVQSSATPHIAPPPMRMSHLLGKHTLTRFRHPFGQSPLHARSILPPLSALQEVRSPRHAIHN